MLGSERVAGAQAHLRQATTGNDAVRRCCGCVANDFLAFGQDRPGLIEDPAVAEAEHQLRTERIEERDDGKRVPERLSSALPSCSFE